MKRDPLDDLVDKSNLFLLYLVTWTGIAGYYIVCKQLASISRSTEGVAEL
jgi:hypothetical protein